jgi:hypothetical protein
MFARAPSPFGRGWREAPGEGIGTRGIGGGRHFGAANAASTDPPIRRLHRHLPPLGEGPALAGILLVMAISMSAPSAFAAPKTSDELVAQVRAAIETQDYDAFDKLVVWDGLGPRAKRLVAMQIRHGLGRPIRSIRLEKADDDIVRQVTEVQGGDNKYALNLPVTHILRIAYADGEAQPGQGDPGAVFLIGASGGELRIALVVRK